MKKYNTIEEPKVISYSEDSKQDENHLNGGQNQERRVDYFHAMLQNYLQDDRPVTTRQIAQLSHSNCQNQLCSSGMVASLFNVVSAQTNSLETLNKRVEEIVGHNRQLLNKVKQLEIENQSLKARHNKREEETMIWKDPLNQIKIQGQSVSKQTLLQILFGKQKYEYSLRLVQEVEKPLYRERNFSIIMQLVDSTNNKVVNSNKIPMGLALYTCENPPKFIEKNTAGQKMLKGYVDQSLIYGVCHFEKVQIRQVTSHYRSGWIFLVAIPCMTPLGAAKSQNFIDYTKIKPLVIDQVIVKAKKPKKRDDKKEESEQ